MKILSKQNLILNRQIQNIWVCLTRKLEKENSRVLIIHFLSWRIHEEYISKVVFKPLLFLPLILTVLFYHRWLYQSALGYQPPSKTPSPFSCQAPCPLNLKTVQAPFLGNPPLYWFIVNPTPPPSYKLDFSINPQNINVFHPLRCCKVINCGDG